MQSPRGFGAALTALAMALAVGGCAGGQSELPAETLPTSISLSAGFRPEGIPIGPGPFAFIGSMADGSIYRADLRTGSGEIFSRGPGTPSLGLKTDTQGRLFVAGGTGGDARVVDTRTGEVLASYRLATGPSFVNDLTFTQNAALVVQNRLNVVAVLRLNEAGTEGHVERRVGDPQFDVPATMAAYESRLYLPNARFTTTQTPDTPYNAVAIPLPAPLS